MRKKVISFILSIALILITSTMLGNVAYASNDGDYSYKNTHEDSPSNTPENTEYILTITGDELGREVNYTLADLENLVEYNE